MTYFKQFQRRNTRVQCGWTLGQIAIALDFVQQMEATGASENCYCLMVERLIDGYMRSRFSDSTAGGYQPRQTPNWSIEAIAAYKRDKAAQLTVEHGSPQRHVMRMALKLYKSGSYNEQSLDRIGRQYWKIAAITKGEDARLRKMGLRSALYPSPDERWAAAGIKVVRIKGFDKNKNIIV